MTVLCLCVHICKNTDTHNALLNCYKFRTSDEASETRGLTFQNKNYQLDLSNIIASYSSLLF